MRESAPERYRGYQIDRERLDLYDGMELSHEGPITYTPAELVDEWFAAFGNYDDDIVLSMIDEIGKMGSGLKRLPDRGNHVVGWREDLFAEFAQRLRARFEEIKSGSL